VQHLLAYLPLLACPVAMGGMMWMVMRGGKSQQSPPPPMTGQQQSELQQLRAELDEIRAADTHRNDIPR
jgi:hypothetical protein